MKGRFDVRNPETVSRLIRDHGPGIRAYMSARVSDWAEAEDLVQETFVAAFEGRDQFREEGEFGAWLYGIARNRLRLYYRRNGAKNRALTKVREGIVELAEGVATPVDAPILKREQLEQLRRCIDKLPERSARLVQGRYFERLDIAELATQLDTSDGAVYTLLTRVRKRLKLCMNEAAM